jgi:hypothetical protein
MGSVAFGRDEGQSCFLRSRHQGLYCLSMKKEHKRNAHKSRKISVSGPDPGSPKLTPKKGKKILVC